MLGVGTQVNLSGHSRERPSSPTPVTTPSDGERAIDEIVTTTPGVREHGRKQDE
jgi:hypothetical protein